MGLFLLLHAPELCKTGWERNWTSTAVVWTPDGHSFTRTATVYDRLWNLRTSHCLVAIFITGRLTCVKDFVSFCVLPQHVTKSDERPIRLAKLCSFWPWILQSFPSTSCLEMLHEGRLFVVWKPELISVGCSGMRWGWVMVFWGQGLELVLTCVKREGDSGNVLNTCNVMESCQSLSVPWRVGGRRRRVHCLWRFVWWEEGVKEKERERTGKRIPARHVSFPSNESSVLSKNYWVASLMINSFKKYTKTQPTDILQKRPFPDWTITSRLTYAYAAWNIKTERWIMGWIILFVELIPNCSPTIQIPLSLLFLFFFFLFVFTEHFFLFPELCCIFSFFDDHLFHCN